MAEKKPRSIPIGMTPTRPDKLEKRPLAARRLLLETEEEKESRMKACSGA